VKYSKNNNPNRKIYNTKYSDLNLKLFNDLGNSYVNELINIRLELIQVYGKGKTVLDLCCGTGEYTLYNPNLFKQVYCIDFSTKMLAFFRERLEGSNAPKVKLILSDARAIAIKDEAVDFAFSFTSLYHVPDVAFVIKEIDRVLRPGGYAVFELGNTHSINNLVAEVSHKRLGTAKSFLIPFGKMAKMISLAGLNIIQHRAFQIMPMWGAGSKLLIPVTHPFWRSLLGVKIRKRMFDEIVSTAWPFRYFAFRHLFICQKI